MFFVLSLCATKAQNYNFQWAKQFGGSVDGTAFSITKDASGNIYTTGEFQGTMDFDPGPLVYNLTSFGLNDIFVSKQDSNGNLVWAKQMGGTKDDYGYSIVLDNSGNIYITGCFWGVSDFDPGIASYTLSASTTSNAYVLKLNPSGNFIWAIQLLSSFPGGGSSITVDNSGNTYSTGYFFSTTDFDPGPGSYTLASGNGDSYVLKLDPSGNLIWAEQFLGGGVASMNIGSSISLDGSANVHVSGWFTGKVDFDPSASTFTYTSNGNRDVYITKLDANGNFIWAKQIGGFDGDYGNAIVANPSGEVYITGFFSNPVDFDPGVGTFTLSTIGAIDRDIFILKLDALGNFAWAKQIGNTQNDYGYNIALDGGGNVYSTGFFQGNVDFDPGAGTFSLSSYGVEDVFISKLDALGNFVWARQLGGSNSDIGYGLYLDSSNDVFTCGNFLAAADFDPGLSTYSLTPFGSSDIFISKLGSCILPSSPTNATVLNNQLICTGNSTTLSAVGSGTVMWYSLSSSGTILAMGNNFVTPTLSTGTYTYYAEDYTCGASIPRTSITVTVSSCVGVNSVSFEEALDLSIFPNPSSGKVTVNYKMKWLGFEIYNSLGEKLNVPFSISKNGSEIDLTNQAEGIYFIRVKYGSNYVTKKLIKQ